MSNDLVLGVVTTPTALGLVMIRGRRADGPVLDRDLVGTDATFDKALDAVLRTCQTATAHGYRIHAIGVTWVGGDAGDAVSLVESLTKAGMSNVVAVDPDHASGADAATVAAAQALGLARVPSTADRLAQELTTVGRHRHSRGSPRPSPLWLIGVAAAAVLTAVVATVDFSPSGPRPSPSMPTTAVPATAVTVARSVTSTAIRTTPPGGSTRVTAATMRPRTAPPPLASVTPSIPADPVAHLPGNDDGPRVPGPG